MMRKIKYLPLFAGIIMGGVVAPSPASATVVISFMGVKICITGKRNPDGCKSVASPNVTTVLVDSATMKKIDASHGRSVTVDAVKERLVSPARAVKR